MVFKKGIKTLLFLTEVSSLDMLIALRCLFCVVREREERWQISATLPLDTVM